MSAPTGGRTLLVKNIHTKVTIDDEIRALKDIGMRFTAVRGSMSIGESKNGLTPGFIRHILNDRQNLFFTLI